MFKARVANTNGETLVLTQNEPKWQVLSITGLDQPQAQINLTNIAGMDGARLNSTKLNTRNIVINLKLNGNVEQNRLELYHFFRTKDNCTFYFENDSLSVFIDGVVETVECIIFAEKETMQISIICPFPYFKSLGSVVADISNRIAAFTFPFSIDYDSPIAFGYYIINRITNVYNGSTAETGLTIEIDIYSRTVEKVKITNTETGEFIEIGYEFLPGDKVVVSTYKSQKYIHLIRDGVVSNIFGALQAGSTFFQLSVGDNMFSYAADGGTHDDEVYIVFKYHNLYRGV